MHQVISLFRGPAKAQDRWDNRNRNKAPGLAGFFMGKRQTTKTKKPPLDGYDITAYCFFIRFIQLQIWCPGRDLNPHSHKPRDFKSGVFVIKA
ncbi:hypothetical protein ACIP6T_03310 [Pantoea sp. NPDC088449]|uniref:hypothetical protein n=1 Tax=Pantoea sp. NPDC088449 TaxID=3364392 RepID=UPI00382B85CE